MNILLNMPNDFHRNVALFLQYVDELIQSFIRAHLPSTEAICSATIPYCQRDYAANGKNLIRLIN